MEFKQIRDRAITDLYKLSIPEKVWKYQRNDMFQDFKQYCYLQLCELSDQKFGTLLDTGDLANYFFILCKRQTCKDSHFFRAHTEKLNISYSYDENDNLEREVTEDFE